jgi:hypothetical protein
VPIGPQILLLLYRMSGLADRDVRFYLGAMGAAVSVATNSVPDRVALMSNAANFNPKTHGRLYIMSSLLLPALDKAFVKESQCLVAIAAADAALAVEAYRAEHAGRLPDSLADLVPRYFEHVPLDPLTEKPFSLAPAAIGYAIIGNGPVFTVRR